MASRGPAGNAPAPHASLQTQAHLPSGCTASAWLPNLGEAGSQATSHKGSLRLAACSGAQRLTVWHPLTGGAPLCAAAGQVSCTACHATGAAPGQPGAIHPQPITHLHAPAVEYGTVGFAARPAAPIPASLKKVLAPAEAGMLLVFQHDVAAPALGMTGQGTQERLPAHTHRLPPDAAAVTDMGQPQQPKAVHCMPWNQAKRLQHEQHQHLTHAQGLTSRPGFRKAAGPARIARPARSAPPGERSTHRDAKRGW